MYCYRFVNLSRDRDGVLYDRETEIWSLWNQLSRISLACYVVSIGAITQFCGSECGAGYLVLCIGGLDT